jgi:alkylhydroperoxidase family enzyme
VETAARLPLLGPGDLSGQQRKVYDAIASGDRAGGAFAAVDNAGRLLGPYNAMLHSPAVGMPLQELGAAIRFRTAFTLREREIAILVVAAHRRSDYAWYAHERAGRAAGLTEEELQGLRAGTALTFADAREQAVYRATRSLAVDGDLDDSVYDATVAAVGPSAIVDLVVLVGYYATLALQMRVFRVGVPTGEQSPAWD